MQFVSCAATVSLLQDESDTLLPSQIPEQEVFKSRFGVYCPLARMK